MGLGALFALVFEQLFDRFRLKPMAGTTIVSAQFALFMATCLWPWPAWCAWGVGMSTHESILRTTVVAELISSGCGL